MPILPVGTAPMGKGRVRRGVEVGAAKTSLATAGSDIPLSHRETGQSPKTGFEIR